MSKRKIEIKVRLNRKEAECLEKRVKKGFDPDKKYRDSTIKIGGRL